MSNLKPIPIKINSAESIISGTSITIEACRWVLGVGWGVGCGVGSWEIGEVGDDPSLSISISKGVVDRSAIKAPDFSGSGVGSRIAEVDCSIAEVDCSIAEVDCSIAEVDCPIAEVDSPIAEVDSPIAEVVRTIAATDRWFRISIALM